MNRAEMVEACMRKLGYDIEQPQECLERWCSEVAPEIKAWPDELQSLTEVCQWIAANTEGALPFTYAEVHLPPAVSSADAEHPPYGEDV